MPDLFPAPHVDAPGTSFQADIVPLFRPMDIQCMRGRGVFLADYDFMSAKDGGAFFNAEKVLAFLKGDKAPRMPFGGPYWSDESLTAFESWIKGGCRP